eukprot:1436952-Rhodomonas_salina.1
MHPPEASRRHEGIEGGWEKGRRGEGEKDEKKGGREEGRATASEGNGQALDHFAERFVRSGKQVYQISHSLPPSPRIPSIPARKRRHRGHRRTCPSSAAVMIEAGRQSAAGLEELGPVRQKVA